MPEIRTQPSGWDAEIPLVIMSRRDLTSSAKGVMGALFYQFRRKNHARCSIKELAKATGVSKSTVVRSVAQLERAGLVRVERPAGDRSWYFPVWPALIEGEHHVRPR